MKNNEKEEEMTTEYSSNRKAVDSLISQEDIFKRISTEVDEKTLQEEETK